MTSPPPELQPIASPTPAHRLSAMSPASGWAPSLRGECPSWGWDGAIARLPLQIPMIAAALKIFRNS